MTGDIQKPKRGRGRPRLNPDRVMTQREINKRYRDRQRAKLELLKKLLEQGHTSGTIDAT